ncbi:MAG: aspartate-semialdehyde dehydrogenase [bacterium]|nr:aspartate-semialdehyde dehydrogenase [bacterium]
MRTAILGATGLVGRAMLDLLAAESWAEAPPALLVSARSAGTKLAFRGAELTCREVGDGAFDGVDIALFSAGGGPSRDWAPAATSAGTHVVDNSSAFRMEPGVPLVVPEINGALVNAPDGALLVANPNCSTIQVAMAVAPLAAWGLRRVDVTTFQAVSGAGRRALAELQKQEQGEEPEPGVFPRTMAANVVPAIGPATAGGAYEEEDKVVRELRKILDRSQDLQVSCTAVRVPVHTGHAAAVRVVCERTPDPAAAARALADFPGVAVADRGHDFATPREIAGDTRVHVGRLRPDGAGGLLMWVVADNLLKGAAWNAVQIARRLAGAAAP